MRQPRLSTGCLDARKLSLYKDDRPHMLLDAHTSATNGSMASRKRHSQRNIAKPGHSHQCRYSRMDSAKRKASQGSSSLTVVRLELMHVPNKGRIARVQFEFQGTHGHEWSNTSRLHPACRSIAMHGIHFASTQVDVRPGVSCRTPGSCCNSHVRSAWVDRRVLLKSNLQSFHFTCMPSCTRTRVRPLAAPLQSCCRSISWSRAR